MDEIAHAQSKREQRQTATITFTYREVQSLLMTPDPGSPRWRDWLTAQQKLVDAEFVEGLTSANACVSMKS